jgi:hypothetical protein
MKVNPALRFVEKLVETTSIKEVAHLLSSGEWIAIRATKADPVIFALGKIKR